MSLELQGNSGDTILGNSGDGIPGTLYLIRPLQIPKTRSPIPLRVFARPIRAAPAARASSDVGQMEHIKNESLTNQVNPAMIPGYGQRTHPLLR